ncbi:MAG: methyltransferase domain-containing protein [Ignavibacterium sp.]|nr:methyltransferase domain-containing protein [Ignavibacterium sp.]
MKNVIDKPALNDNRNYNYSGFEEFERPDYKYIIELVEENSKVIDLGCGNGSLIKLLKENKNCNVKGIEISDTGVQISRSRGLDVNKGRIDEKLPFSENEFDYSICHVTIQMLMYPEILIREMKRISEYQIISFPNFAFYKNRLEFLFKGKMPEKMLFGYKWYNTGHIHQLSIKDFFELINEIGGFEVLKQTYVKSDSVIKNFLMKLFPNLFQQVSIFLLSKYER